MSLPSSDTHRISVQGIGFSYAQGTPVLDNVQLEVLSGCVTMIVGRSGSGKTTLLKILQGLLPPRSGRVIRSSAELVTAYVPQGLGLVRNQTSLQNVLTGSLRRIGTFPSLFGIFPKKTIAEAAALLERVGLGHKLDSRVSGLSGGERQRVAIARCLMQRPHLVMADEFVSQLDAVTSIEILGLMRETADQGIGWVVTTHDLDTACALADRVVALKEGRVRLDRTRPLPSVRELMGVIS